MSVKLSEGPARERAKVQRVEAARSVRARSGQWVRANGGYLTPAELASECAGAVRAEPLTRPLSDDERDSLAQAVAVSVLTRATASTEARPLTRTAALAESVAERKAKRYPALSARTSPVERGAVGRNYLRAIVRGMLRDSREWRDVAATYAERERQDRADRRTARVAMLSLDHLSERPEAGDYLTRAALRDLERRAVEQESAADVVAPIMLAQAVATVLLRDAGDLLTDRDRRCIRTALAVAAGEPVAIRAARESRSVKAVRKDVEHGRNLLRESAQDVREALTYVRHRLARATGQAVQPREWQAAAQAVERVTEEERKRATAHRSASIGTVAGSGTAPLARFQSVRPADPIRPYARKRASEYRRIGTDRADRLARTVTARPDLAAHLTAPGDLTR